MADAVRWRVYNFRTLEGVTSDGKTWSSIGNLVYRASIVGSFDSWDVYFRMPDNHYDSDQVMPRFQGYYTGGQSLYYDDVSIFGPVLRPGYATW